MSESVYIANLTYQFDEGAKNISMKNVIEHGTLNKLNKIVLAVLQLLITPLFIIKHA